MIAKTNVEQPARGLSRAGNSALSVVSRTPTHIIATQGDLEIVIWRGSTTLDAVETIRTSLGELTRSYPKGIGVLQVVEVTAPPPDAAARNALSNVLRGAGKAVRGSAIVFEGTGNEDDGFTYATELLTSGKPPTAIFCANDRTAWGAYQAAAELHLSIPGDVSIVGFDNQETLAPHLRPGLTTLELPFVEMGRRAVDLILQGAEPDGRVEFMTCPLIERNSVTHPKEKP